MSNLPDLFSPIKLRHCEIRNRILISGHVNGMAGEASLPNERELRYHEARAKGGYGLIVMGAAAVSPHSWLFPSVIQGWRDEIVPWYRKISDAVHAHGSKLMVQAWHNGHQETGFYSWANAQCPSQIVSAGQGEAPAAMDEDDIRQAVKDYVDFALRCKEGGLDGVELHFAHGYLPQQFLSPYSNIRTDRYGGSLENRMRFGMELIDAVREAVGGEFVVGLRVSGDEMIPAGLKLADMKVIAPVWAETGKIDYLNISGGTYRSIAPFVGPMMVPAGSFVYMAAEIRQVVDIPVFAAVRINDPVMADNIIRNGEADMVVMTRASICDPEMPNKARAGRIDDIRLCIACNEGCWERIEHHQPITCMQNPETGREGVFRLEPAPRPKNVVVIGGGPAGMKAAAAARARGHRVTLFERKSELGGAILVPARLPARQEWSQCVRFLAHELKRLGVTVRTGTEATAALVLAENPDAVIVATGSVPFGGTAAGTVGPDAAIRVEDGAHVVTAEDVIEGRAETGDKVVIADFQNYMKGMITAEYLADRGKDVTLVMPLPFRLLSANPYDIDKPTHAIQTWNMTAKGVRKISDFEVKKAAPGRVTIRNVFTEKDEILEADTLVTCYWRRSEGGLYDELKGRVKELRRIGDCLAPRRVINAIYEGYKAGMEI
ncbi:MAG: FAD-dependent oxidoreductase [Deltaproteobacteria bacterium]|nr:FAD-dependent oxidoreductase [Deltaproteobacteria bacterium]